MLTSKQENGEDDTEVAELELIPEASNEDEGVPGVPGVLVDEPIPFPSLEA